MPDHTPPTDQQLDEIAERLSEARLVADKADWMLQDYQVVRQQQADAAALLDEVRRLRAILDAEKTAHLFTLRQRNNRSQRLAALHDLALAGDLDGLAAAAKNVLAASVDDHRGCGERAAARPAVRPAVETGARPACR